jgi:Ca-activated chloride channel family protein
MLRLQWCVCVLILVLAASSVGGVRAQEPDQGELTFRAGVEMVRLTLTVRDRDGRLLTTLARDDFEVLVNDRAVDIKVFASERRPITVGLLFGPAGGDERGYERLETLRAAGRGLIEALEPDERAVIGSYGIEIALSPIVTSDRVVLRRIVGEELWSLSGNMVVRAVDTTVAALASHPGKRAIVVVTGGDHPDHCPERLPCLKEADVRARALDRGTSVHGVVLASSVPVPAGGGNAEPVRRMTRETGGGYRRLSNDEDIQRAMAEILDEVRHEYLLGFMPPDKDGGEHRARVRMRRPGLTARIIHVPIP